MVDPETGNHQIIDFGLSVCLPTPNTLIRGKCGTECFAAPEIVRDRQYGLSADIYSYGMLLFVLFTEKNPCKPSIRSSYLKRYTSPKMYRFIMKCLDEIPKNRSSAYKNLTVYPIHDTQPHVFDADKNCCFSFFFCVYNNKNVIHHKNNESKNESMDRSGWISL
jgi:serine/threonine protein kinase